MKKEYSQLCYSYQRIANSKSREIHGLRNLSLFSMALKIIFLIRFVSSGSTFLLKISQPWRTFFLSIGDFFEYHLRRFSRFRKKIYKPLFGVSAKQNTKSITTDFFGALFQICKERINRSEVNYFSKYL